ncbi:MAG: histidine phosphotransferase family protein [Alphaproteobacteria bacterium]
MSDNPLKLSPSDLAALMCARICHDIISPISALGTALEVLDDENNTDMHEDALDLVRLSARQASGKLQFLRLTFGAGGSAPGIIGVETLKTLVHGIYGDSKATISWEAETDGIDKSKARLLLNMVMMAVQSVPRGGTVNINVDTLTLKANGFKARIDAAVHQTLSGRAPEDGFDGRSIQPFYAGLIARELKGRITAEIDGEDVTFKAVLPEKIQPDAA